MTQRPSRAHLALALALLANLTGCPSASGGDDDGGSGGGGGTLKDAGAGGGGGTVDAGLSLDAGSVDAGAVDGGGALAVVTTALTGADQGVAYTGHLEATGGMPPYAWAMTSGALPSGLTLSSNGTVSGTPAASGAFNFAVQVTDSAAMPAQAVGAVSLVVTTPLVLKTLPAPPNASLGEAYSTTFIATGGTMPYVFSTKASSLPAGLTLSADGVLSGTPTAAGRAPFSITVTDSTTPVAQVATQRFVVVVNGGGVLLVATPSLPGGVVGSAYQASLTASSGTTPYTWSKTAGVLPAGLTLGLDGTIAGTPTASGPSTFTVEVKDFSTPKQTATAELTLDIAPLLGITTSTLPSGAQGSTYTATIAAVGGFGTPTFALTSGSLPAGLGFANNGVISGTPSQTGTFGFVVTASDASQPPQTSSVSLSLTISPPLALALTPLPGGTVTAPYSKALKATGGLQPYAWSLASGSLPTGLTLSPAGVISGTPSAAGASSFTVTVADSSSPPQTVTSSTLTLFIGGAGSLTIVTSTLPTAVVDDPAYLATLTAAGGTPPYTWSIVSGVLPSGLTLSSAGDITGSAAASGSAMFTVQVTDTSLPLQTATAELILEVNDALHITTTVLAAGSVGAAYISTLGSTGGQGPLTWALGAESVLPTGLTLTPTGSLTGTPTESGTFAFSVVATDSATPSQSATADLTLAVTPQLLISTADLPDGLIGEPYALALSGTGGTTPYTWSISGGMLPAGLTLTAAGLISGTPTASGNYLTQVKLTDAQGLTKAVVFSYFINGAGTLTIISGPPPAAIAMQPYSQPLLAAGGTAPYSWVLTADSLPPGLSLSPAGVISGTTSDPGTYVFSVSVSDASMPVASATQTFQLVVISKLSVKTSSLPNPVLATPYSSSLRAQGGVAPYTWSIASGTLPVGLSLDAATGLIAGVATVAGDSTFTVRVSDSGSKSQEATKQLTLTVTGALAISTTSPLSPVVMGASTTVIFAATGGTQPYSWSTFGGGSVPGLALTGVGVLSGTPTAAGTSSFTLRVEDTSRPKRSALRNFKLTVSPALTVTVSNLPAAVQALAYASTLTAAGGNPPYTWSVVTGTLPAGLTLAPTTGVISGTPTGSGTSNFTVRVADSTVPSVSATKPLSIAVGAAGTLSITTESLPNGVAGAAYPSTTLLRSGGTGPFAWSVTSGALPSGITLSSGGVLSGTPTAAGSYSMTFTVTDSLTATANRNLTLSVDTALLITSPDPLPVSIIDQPYLTTLTSSGGTGVVTWSLTSGSEALPSGLSLSANGQITGTPSGPKGMHDLTLQATDSGNPAQTATLTVKLNVDTKMTIATATLPDGQTGVLYTQTNLMVSGGTAPVLWSTQGTLPPGITVSLLGVVKGTPTTAGTYSFTVTAIDAYKQPVLRALQIVVH